MSLTPSPPGSTWSSPFFRARSYRAEPSFGLPIKGGGGGAEGLGGDGFGLWWPLSTMAACCAQLLARGLPLQAVRQPPAMGSLGSESKHAKDANKYENHDDTCPARLQSTL